MKRVFKSLLICLLAFAFYGSSFYLPWLLNPDGTASVAEAKKTKPPKPPKPPKPCKGKKCQPPPTVSELPIQYMVAGGLAFILVSGGIVYLTRNRSNKQSSEV